MNVFQQQLILGDGFTLHEKTPNSTTPEPPPRRAVSAEEFEADMQEIFEK